MDQNVKNADSIPTIALVGNPNSGKTSLFNLLSGLNQRVGNFPGVTVDRKKARLNFHDTPFDLVDLPGINSLYAQAEDERITTDILNQPDHPDFPDQVYVVADGTQLRRGLMLCMQVMDLGFPTVLVINMVDLLEKDEVRLDVKAIQEYLLIPIHTVSVLKGTGIKELKRQLSQKIEPASHNKPLLAIPPAYKQAKIKLQAFFPNHTDYHLYQHLLSDPGTEKISLQELEAIRKEVQLDPQSRKRLIHNELLVRLDRADGILDTALKQPATTRERITERVDQILTHRIWGYVIFLAILMFIFQSLFTWAQIPMGWIESLFGWLGDSAKTRMDENWIRDLLVEGILPGLEGVVIFVPQIAILFLFISLLEDSGYMARAVYIMDRLMRPFGFSGRSMIPLIGGMACAIPSIMMARGISNPKERLITIMVTPLISCSARLPVYTLLIALFVPDDLVWGFLDKRGLVMTGMYFFGFFLALIVAWVFKNILKYDSNGLFVMEMPAYRRPQWRNVALTVGQKSWAFIAEAGKIIFFISIILWLLVRFGPTEERQAIEEKYEALLAEVPITPADSARADSLNSLKDSDLLNSSYASKLGKFIEPAIRPLGYDWKIGISLITSFAAREVFVGTMSIIYQQDDPSDTDDEQEEERRYLKLADKLQQEKDPRTGLPIYTLATVLSLLMFYAISMQCVSTLAVTRKEAGWKWALIMLLYLMALAYVTSWLTYLIASNI